MRSLLAALLVVAAVLFAIGSAVERNQESGGGEASATATESQPESGVETGSEGAGAQGGDAAHAESGGGSEDLLGINPESTGLVIVAIACTVLLAAAVWFRPIPVVLLAVVAFGLVFAALDVRELVHQVNESRAGIAVVAAVLTVLHLAIAGTAVALLRAEPRPAV
jgi:hypothetical protein